MSIFQVCRHLPPPPSIHTPLFSLCSSSRFLISGPDFLPPPPLSSSVSPPPSHRPSSVFYPSSFPPEEDRAPLSLDSANTSEAFIIVVCVGKHARVYVYTAHSQHFRHTLAVVSTHSSPSPPKGQN